MRAPASRVRPDRLLARLDAFARIGATPGGGVDRQALTDGDRQARGLLARLGQGRGFAVAQDGMANLFVRREGRDPDAPPVLVGSHLDTQPSGGRYDGALGVLAALEVLESLEDDGVSTERAVELVCWTNEEGSRFSPGAMGSMAFATRSQASRWSAVEGRDGSSLAAELAATLAVLDVGSRPIGSPVHCYVELHIEQGPVLESEGIPIGVVTGIQGVRWLEVRLEGQAAHAGTTPRAHRRDPLAAAAEAIHRLSERLMPKDPEARFTVGRMAALPGSVNAIAQVVTFSIDLRHPLWARLDALENAVQDVVAAAAARHGCRAEVTRTLDMAPCAFPAAMVATVEVAARRAGAPSRRMMSGAYHDALFVAAVAPSAMIFIPCRDGLSHNEAEFAEPSDIAAGAEVLYEAVRDLAGSD
jgi:N-carbamoyl-L-amino-acid hydrolase